MAVTKSKKAELIGKFQAVPGDTGTPQVQVALITEHIKELSEHLQKNKKDTQGQLGLLKLVGKRKRLLSYLKKQDVQEYTNLIAELGIRK